MKNQERGLFRDVREERGRLMGVYIFIDTTELYIMIAMIACLKYMNE